MSKKAFSISSLSHKYFMAAAGAFLMLFLITHLTTNLLLLRPDDGAAFNAAVEFLLTNPAIKIMEYALFAGFLIHIIIGIVLEVRNRRSRPVGYYVATKSGTSAFSKFMIHTGIVILFFLILHLYHFFFVKVGLRDVYAPATSATDFYNMVMHVFKNPIIVGIYVVSVVVLGLHLKHAFHSAFQTFGLNHNKYTPGIKIAGTVYAVLVTIGFAAIPLVIYFS